MNKCLPTTKTHDITPTLPSHLPKSKNTPRLCVPTKPNTVKRMKRTPEPPPRHNRAVPHIFNNHNSLICLLAYPSIDIIPVNTLSPSLSSSYSILHTLISHNVHLHHRQRRLTMENLPRPRRHSRRPQSSQPADHQPRSYLSGTAAEYPGV